MFSHLLTAAKGLFPGQETAEPASNTASSNRKTPSQSPAITDKGKADTMAEGSTRINSNSSNIAVVITGKRKTQLTGAGNAEGQNNKRRKGVGEENGHGIVNGRPHEEHTQDVNGAAKKHFRFGSEEPAIPLDTPAEETSETVQPDNREDGEDSSDDEAPEAVDNSTQLSSIKAEAKKRERAKQMLVDSPSTYVFLQFNAYYMLGRCN